jgi:hypothetical protein
MQGDAGPALVDYVNREAIDVLVLGEHTQSSLAPLMPST